MSQIPIAPGLEFAPGVSRFGGLPVAGHGAGTPVDTAPFTGDLTLPQPSSFRDKFYQVLTVDLSIARTNTLISFQRKLGFVWSPNGTSLTALLNIALGDGDFIPFLPGTKIANLIYFDRVFLNNAAQAAQNITVMVAESWAADSIETDA